VLVQPPSVLVNGSPTKEFLIERGLRQGDSLSPLLFLLVAEGFNVLISSLREADTKATMWGVRMGLLFPIFSLQMTHYYLVQKVGLMSDP